MEHILEDDMILLTQKIQEKEYISEKELDMLDHIENCPECTKDFCSYMTIADALSSFGMNVIKDRLNQEKTEGSFVTNRVIATLEIVKDCVADNINYFLKQIREKTDAFCFEQPLEYAFRGESSSDNNISKLEDVNNSQSYIIYDSNEHKLMIRIAAADTEGYIVETGGKRVETIKEGFYHVVVIDNVYDGDIKIYEK